MTTHMGKYPRLMKFNNTSQYEGIVLFMTEPHHGIALYIPASQPEEVLGSTYTPSSSELDDYTGSVTLRTSADPVLGS